MVLQPQLVLVVDRSRPWSGGARHSLANIERVTIGRGRERLATRICQDGKATLQLLLPHERVSTLHARIERQGGEWHFEDCSTNGSRVGGRDVRHRVLADGDIIEIASTFFRYRAEVSAPANAPGDVDWSDLDDFPRTAATLVPSVARDLLTLSRVAASNVPVLLRGETGTGKEVVARAVHAASGRTGAFVAVNCGALPATLVESLLFGHKRGAFSGATQDEMGLVRTAQGGTLFLDEVGDLGVPAQAAVLRMLQEGEVMPVGATRPIATDARIVSATHRPIEALAASGEFRQDLLARICGFTHRVPLLRHRIDDLGLLIATLLRKVAGERVTSLSLASNLVHAMLAHDWPGNVRELEQCLRVGAVLAVAGRIELEHVWRHGRPDTCAEVAPPVGPAKKALSNEDEELRAQLVAALAEHRGNLTHVAQGVGKRRTTVQRWIRRFGINPEQFRP